MCKYKIITEKAFFNPQRRFHKDNTFLSYLRQLTKKTIHFSTNFSYLTDFVYQNWKNIWQFFSFDSLHFWILVAKLLMVDSLLMASLLILLYGYLCGRWNLYHVMLSCNLWKTSKEKRWAPTISWLRLCLSLWVLMSL